ncbi:MAG: class I SAM-dependent methyltransferase [Chloroflexi bacterium]|nr:class I SAM-dependent methyltransferase [Chloroflexota bacterium]
MTGKNDYVSVVYDERRTPKTDYPLKLASYLVNRFALKKGDKLLEVGCGRGDFLEAFQRLGIDCYGLDQAVSAVENLGHLQVKKADVSIEPFPFEGNAFDVVYHKSLIEHLYSPEHLMRETYRILRPGGRAIILTPDWVSQMKVFYEDFTHCRPYDVTSLRDALQIYGFSEITTERFYQLPIVWSYPGLKILCKVLQIMLSTPNARSLTRISRIKLFRWAVELMVLGTGVKKV